MESPACTATAAVTTRNVKHSYYYSANMRRIKTYDPPVQPRRENRTFLKYAEKPLLPDTPTFTGTDENDEAYSIGLQELPIEQVIPRYNIKDINFNSLQTWLTNLGAAIYNPLLMVQTPDGQYHSSRDGDHRSRCLWEIGEPLVRVVLRQAATTELKGVKRHHWKTWLRKYYLQVESKPAHRYMLGYPRSMWKRIYRRYYPPLWKPSAVLQAYFNEPTNDGKYFKHTLFSNYSFREIYAQWKQTAYRLDIVDKILERVKIQGKTVLDIGPFYGWASFMLLESGAAYATALEHKRHRYDVIRHIAAVRAYPVKAVLDRVQNYYSKVEWFDVVLMLNMFHHVLAQTPDTAWQILNSLVGKCERLYLMMGAKPSWGILSEWGDDVEKALAANVDGEVKPLMKTAYRNRVLYEITCSDSGTP